MPFGERKLDAHVLKKIGSLGRRPKREGHGAILEAVFIRVRSDSDRLVGREGGVESRVEGAAKVEAVARDNTRAPQGDVMFNVSLIIRIPGPLA